ncbi:MAG TPA: protein kinase, partial [Solirubrobacterales bacterium]
AGGMGEVYRARDTRIGREVALKVLPASYSADPDRLRRFEQEARAAGALNHPNVLTLHDVGRHDGTPYIVSELLEGETLRAKLSRGPLGVAKALDYAVQIARGLAAAHDRGIVHRDLKPENVFVTRDERVKILDFGIAKLIEPARPDEAIDEAATATRGTEAGTVVGTAGYMSPEQVRGRPADHRSDLFSFGAILHEMLTGRRTFKGESRVETMNAVLNGEPSPIVEANPQVPPLLERIVRRCLEKSPENRFQSARDLAFALEATQGSPRPPVPNAKRRIAWAVAVLAAVTAVITIVFLQRRDPEERRPLRTSILPPENTSFVTGGQAHPALSPDGRRIAFLARNREGKIWLWVRALSDLAPHPVAETDIFGLPFWAPDGRQLGFSVGGRLKKADLATGAVQDLCDASRQRGATWNRDGIILFSPRTGDVIYRVPASGGSPAPVTRLDPKRGDIANRWPFFLPDGRHFLFLVAGRAEGASTADVYVGSLDSDETRLLVRDASNAEYVATGHLVFARQGNLLAVPFDANRLAIGGEPVLIARDVAYFKPNDLSTFSTSANGTVAYLTAPVRESRLVWLDRAGRDVGSVGEPDRPGTTKRTFGGVLRVSPDGRSIAFMRLDPETQNGHIWVHDSARGTATRATFQPAFYNGVVWSPEGQRLVFGGGQYIELREKALAGSSEEKTLFSSPYTLAPLDWSHDGRFILYRLLDPKTAWDLWAMPLSGELKPWPIVRTRFNEYQARLSKDGRWMAYTADESGRAEVYVRPFPGSEDKWLISTGGGASPCWRADGRELFY